MEVTNRQTGVKRDFIRYAEFNVTYEALEAAMQADIETYDSDCHINWVEPLAYLGTKYGGRFFFFSKERPK